jgi:uncharacterized protein with PIN domain
MLFFADEMLGKLARWLRMTGFDVLYERQISDDALIARARQEGRTILTRDTRLILRLKKEEYFFVTQDHLEDQYREFFKRFPSLLSERRPFSRCVECNAPLQPVDKEEVRERVWPFVFQTQENFTACPSCRRVYWQATHVAKIRAKLDRLMRG